jgi:hypothetical protein
MKKQGLFQVLSSNRNLCICYVTILLSTSRFIIDQTLQSPYLVVKESSQLLVFQDPVAKFIVPDWGIKSTPAGLVVPALQPMLPGARAGSITLCRS